VSTPQSTADLLEGLAAGRRYKYVFFWGDTPGRDGMVDASCLSQWYGASFDVDGVRYATAEHWMMAGKARLFGDHESEQQVIAAGHPHQAKTIGREVRGFETERWQRHRFNLVVQGNIHKFEQNPAILNYLRAPAIASWSRPARSTASGASASPAPTSAPNTPPSGAASTSSASP
jgi:ribA/ribD-fused uncharacterized protein